MLPAHLPRSILHLLVYAALATLGLSACSPRYSIHEVRATGFENVGDGYLRSDSLLTVAYDFWSPNGVPYVSLYNESTESLELDLQLSTVDGSWGRETLSRVLQDQGAVGFRQNTLVLLPQQWTSFYGVPQQAQQSFGTNYRQSNRTVYFFQCFQPDYPTDLYARIYRPPHRSHGGTSLQALRRRHGGGQCILCGPRTATWAPGAPGTQLDIERGPLLVAPRLSALTVRLAPKPPVSPPVARPPPGSRR